MADGEWLIFGGRRLTAIGWWLMLAYWLIVTNAYGYWLMVANGWWLMVDNQLY